MKRDAEHHRNWFLIASMTFLVGVGVLAIAHTLWIAHLRGRVDDHLDAWRARGLPATLEELNAWYEREPPVPNAADAYDAAFAQYVGDKNLSISTNIDEVCAHVTSNSVTLALLHEAADIEEYYRPLDFGKAGYQVPHIQDFLRAGRLLKASGRCAIRDGQYDTVGDNMAVLLEMSEDLSSEPMIITQLIGHALTAIANSIVREAIEEGAPAERHLLAWADILAPHADPISMKTGLMADFAQANDLFLHDPEGLLFGFLLIDIMPTNRPIEIRMGMGAYALSGLLLLDHLKYLETMTTMHDSHLDPYTEWQDSFRTILAHIDDLPSLRFLTRAILSNYTHVVAPPLRASAEIRSAIAALAVERYRIDHGVLPSSLDELVPTYLQHVPEDPFTGADLLYRVEEPGYVIYSTGIDGNDNGGIKASFATASGSGESDIVFRVDWGGR